MVETRHPNPFSWFISFIKAASWPALPSSSSRLHDLISPPYPDAALMNVSNAQRYVLTATDHELYSAPTDRSWATRWDRSFNPGNFFESGLIRGNCYCVGRFCLTWNHTISKEQMSLQHFTIVQLICVYMYCLLLFVCFLL